MLWFIFYTQDFNKGGYNWKCIWATSSTSVIWSLISYTSLFRQRMKRNTGKFYFTLETVIGIELQDLKKLLLQFPKLFLEKWTFYLKLKMRIFFNNVILGDTGNITYGRTIDIIVSAVNKFFKKWIFFAE